ncbi:DEAD/DEAH box helicase family protein [Bosea sp. PAMC 26642]|uniref:DEAD/DEAH box helicase family protein n=1 Tax=Bosea sp. (strain PAMC 26642) TaxID=1792307 RepID=UPI000770572D|nr:DEAD/DEAH box helicase family protein [Bosea sp. PAMC 26642]AMJ63185.1 type III restriction endonuclease subunit R [Bosea sp. PAMC 26642]
MPVHPDFPKDPFAIIDPDHRWYPGEAMLGNAGLQNLLPPLVDSIRRKVTDWRLSGYSGASRTTRALLRWWFQTAHVVPQGDGTMARFRWYFAQREAVETAIWLFEVAKAHDPYALIKFDSSGAVSKQMFLENWTRYVLKLATGAGKTKVMSILIVWSYFHKAYEADSALSRNFLVVAPNIIVLDRLRTDFEGGRIFFADPLLPENGHDGQNWQDDFQISVHIQDQIGHVPAEGNLFLTNIHRVFDGDGRAPSFDDVDTTDYFLGRRPVTKTTDSQVDLGRIVREVSDLVVLNDEAHHLHERNAWFRAIEDIHNALVQKGGGLAAQFDVTATPKHSNGAIFVQTVSDYPLVEAIHQGVVKTPVVPDLASRAKLEEHQSADFSERYRDFLHLGYREWQKSFEELSRVGRKPVLFVMTDDTRNCDAVADYLGKTYTELNDAVLVIHTKANGDISESSSGKSKEELDRLRQASRDIDKTEDKNRAVVSVMVLREGWDVQGVTVIVGLRAYSSEAKILPEQTLGRGLRRMFRGQDVQEKVSVIGTPAFMDFVEGIRSEGVELEMRPMGDRTPGAGPMVVEVDLDNPDKDIQSLDIELPVLTRRLEREYKNLEQLDPASIEHRTMPLKAFSPAEQRQIVFKHIDDDTVSHVTEMGEGFTPTPQNVIGFFANAIRRDMRLVGGFEILFGKLKGFVSERLFGKLVPLDDLNVLRNLSEPEVVATIMRGFKKAINELTVVDRGTSRVENRIKLSHARPMVVKQQDDMRPKRSLFNRVVGDSALELAFAGFLDDCPDILSFAKNAQHTGFSIEYRTADGSISSYIPDFLVKRSDKEVWIVETKGREDVNDPEKWRRLKLWCADASATEDGVVYRALFVPEEEWEKRALKRFDQAVAVFDGVEPLG